jgi:hypothetical protein
MTHRRDNLSEKKKQFWSRYFAKSLSVTDIVTRKNYRTDVRRLEDNKDFWKGFLYGVGNESRR